MTSAFQPLRQLDSGVVLAYEGLARSVSAADAGLSLWKLLDHTASDDESVELDRLCRMLHAINFFRQQQEAQQADLYLTITAATASVSPSTSPVRTRPPACCNACARTPSSSTPAIWAARARHAGRGPGRRRPPALCAAA